LAPGAAKIISGADLMHRAVAAFVVSLFSPIAFAQTQGIFVTPIPNAPLLAVVTTEGTRILEDGTVLNQRTLSAIARDNQGRIFNEQRPWVPASDTNVPPILTIHIYDPQTRQNTFLRPQDKVAWQNTVNHPPATQPPARGGPAGQYVKEEDLGTRRMEGVDCHGIRDTQTIPADLNGGKELKVVDEVWYSNDLRLNMLVIHNDPRTGDLTTTVTQVSRSEPDPAIFAIPAEYKIVSRQP
jgi:hypothetical protein